MIYSQNINSKRLSYFLNSFQNVHCLSELRKRYDSIESLPERSLTVCSGLDMVNITLNHFIFSDKETTEVKILCK